MKSTFNTSRPVPQHRIESKPEVISGRRGAAGNHLRVKPHAPKLETEARQAAVALLRGERQIGRRLTKTGAAGWKPEGSQGRPLPQILRNEFELAFGADLSAVRIHNDAGSHIAADQEQAIAFTSGRDIYLRRGALERKLLAHEVAHTIQQTAVSQSDGRFRVTDRAGDSDVQYERASPLSSTDPIPDIDTIFERHKSENISDTSFIKEAERIRGELNTKVSTGNEESFWNTWSDAALAMKSIPDNDVRKWQLIFDLLKFKGRWDGAANLLVARYKLMTAFYSAGLFPALAAVRAPGDIVNMGVNLRPAFFDRFPDDRFYATTIEFLIGPTRDIQDLGTASHHFGMETDEVLKEREAPVRLIENEQFYVAVVALKAADKQRQALLWNAVKTVGGESQLASFLTPEQRRAVAQELVDRSAEIIAGKPPSSLEPEAAHIFMRVVPRIKAAAEDALNFWNLAIALFDAGPGVTEETRAAAAAVIRTGAQRWEYKSFIAEFEKPVRALLKLDERGFPQPVDDYTAARDALAAAIRSLSRQYLELPMIAEAKKKPTPNVIRTVLFFGAFLARLFPILDVLKDYDPDLDRLFGEGNKLVSPRDPKLDGQEYPAPDYRVEHRYKLGHFLWMLSTTVPMPAIKELADQVIAGTQPESRRSFIALIGNWTEDASSDYHDLLGDFSASEPISGFGPLRALDIVRLYDLLFNIAYSLRLNQVLRESEYKFEGERPKPKVAQEHEFVKSKLPTPKRYTVEQWAVSMSAKDEDAYSFGDLILDHPKTKRFLDEHLVDGQIPIHVVPEDTSSVYLWIIPATFTLLIKPLRQVPAINEALTESPAMYEKLERVPTIEDVKALSDLDWIFVLSDWMSNFTTPDAMAAAIETIQSTLKTGVSQSEALVTTLERSVSIRDRVNWVSKRLAPLIQAWDPTDPLASMNAPEGAGLKGKAINIEVPTMVANELGALSTYMRPPAERPLHFALSVLEFARLPGSPGGDPPIDRLKAPRDRWKMDVVGAWSQLLENAVTIIENRRAELPLVMTPEELADPTFVDTRLALIKSVIQDLSATKTRVERSAQESYGIQGLRSKDGTGVLLGLGHGFNIKQGETFTIGDIKTSTTIQWTIEQVYTDFIFKPSYGSEPAKLYITDSQGEPYLDSTENPIEATKDQQGQPLVRISKTIDNQKVTRDLYFNRAGDLADLDALTFAINMEAMKRGLENLKELTEGFAELTMDVVEMIPGMQWMMGVRLFMSIVQFIASPEFEVLKQEIAKDPTKIITEALRILVELVRPEDLWQYLLFGNSKFNRLHGNASPPQSKLKGSTGLGSKIMSLLTRLYQFGKELLGSTSRLQTQVRWKLEAVEMAVLRHLLLATILRFVAIHFDEILEAANRIVESVEQAERTFDKIQEAFAEWPEKVDEMVQQLENPKLPDQIIPMEQVVEVIIGLVLSRLSFKYRMAGNVVIFLLQKVGKDQEVYKMIVDALGDANPNKLWFDDKTKTGLKVDVEADMKSAGYTLASLIYGTLAQLPDTLVGTTQKEAFAGKKAAADKYVQPPQTTPPAAPFGWNAGMSARFAMPPDTAGNPLPRNVLTGVQNTYGQDFSHVRLHQDAAAARYTSNLGAAAVTSGSHVYMQPGIAPASSAGSHVLRHELAHVVQQTGPRPLNRSWGATPQGGYSPVVRHDGALEAQADRAARGAGALSASSRARGPQQASLKSIAARFLIEITGSHDVAHDAAAAERPGLTTIPQEVKNRTSGLWASFQHAARELKATGSFYPAQNMLRKYLSDTTATSGGTHVKKHVDRVILDSTEEEKVETDPQGDKKVTYRLNEKRLNTALERYVLGAAGIQTNITFKPVTGKEALVEVASIEVTYVHLPVIYGGEDLWKEAIKGKVSDADRPSMIPRLRSYLAGKDISIGLWKLATYALADSVYDDLEAQKKLGGSGVLEPSELPPKIEYLKTDAGSAGSQIGLRLGVYDDKKSGKQSGKGRESHHMTQFLLLDYFRNDTTVKAFEFLTSSHNPYYGLEAPGGTINAFKVPGQQPIKIDEFHQRRGGKMPCILLSREAHRMPGLHVTTNLDDLPNEADSPAGVVKGWFTEALKAKDEKFGTDFFSATDIDQYATPAKRDAARAAMYEAMEKTYHQVWDDRMKKGLERALMGPELFYYNDMAKQRNMPEITEGEMRLVYSAAVQHLEAGLKAGGWV